MPPRPPPGKAVAPPAAAPPSAAIRPPRKVALLLPLAGAERPLAEAVRDGFLAAYLADGATAERPQVVVLDEAQPNAAAAYDAAVVAGANMVVGPLLKESVAAVAASAGKVPVLTLNYLDSGEPAPGREFFQFSLAPEDEAREAAERAAAAGQLRAVALVPDSDWGRRLLGAYTATLESRGGTVLAYRIYDPSATDFTAPIQRLLLLDESRERHRRLSAFLGTSLGFEPRRRADVDCIFLAATTAAGRLIGPQLRFLYAGDVPTYATSAIYQAGADADLDGIMFMDAPAIIGDDPRALELRAAIASNWPPGALNLLRLYAMGYDAYSLMTRVRAGPPIEVAGLSGDLSMDADRRVHRQMPWAVFRNGSVTLLPPLTAGETARR